LAVPPPPHVWPVGQVPQSSVPPQPSGMAPQLSPAAAQVVGTQFEHLKLAWQVLP